MATRRVTRSQTRQAQAQAAARGHTAGVAAPRSARIAKAPAANIAAPRAARVAKTPAASAAAPPAASAAAPPAASAAEAPTPEPAPGATWTAGLRDANYTQLCIVQGLGYDSTDPLHRATFDNMTKTKLGMKHPARIVGTVTTGPGQGGPGGRTDFFFLVHKDDVSNMTLARIAYGIRWWDDVYDNGHGSLYPAAFLAAYPPSW